jgi:hypothetical protein
MRVSGSNRADAENARLTRDVAAAFDATCRLPPTEEASIATYRMVYGDSDEVVRETFDDVEIEREDGWTVLFRDRDAILRVRDEHVQSLERLDGTDPDGRWTRVD